MSYTLAIQQTNKSKNANFNKLSQQILSSEYQIIFIKHHQNFYDQSSSYFIIIDSKAQQNSKQKQVRMKKVFSKTKQAQTKQQDKQRQKFHQNPQIKKSDEIKCYLGQSCLFYLNRIIGGNFIHENFMIVLSNPFELYFITKNCKSPIKILLEGEYNLSGVVASFSSQSNEQQKRKQPYSLTIYGFDQNSQSNKILNVNLMTFDIKQINQSKDYSPKSRINHFNMFHDDRLYVYGGQILNKKQEQQLLWSFDIQKGYWFALQMEFKQQDSIFNQYLSTVYDSGKIVILKDSSFYILEIYQCKIWKLQLQLEEHFKKMIQNKQVIGMVTFDKRIYFYTKNSILQRSISLLKQKPLQKQKQIVKSKQKGLKKIQEERETQIIQNVQKKLI